MGWQPDDQGWRARCAHFAPRRHRDYDICPDGSDRMPSQEVGHAAQGDHPCDDARRRCPATYRYTRAGSADDFYLFDDEARIKTGDKDDGDGLSAVDGINRIRKTLREPGHVVRLVGLSGVGKTRVCEALFDAKIGKDSLDPSLAIYTNV